MVFSICEWGMLQRFPSECWMVLTTMGTGLFRPWLWGPFTGNMWRVGPDHLPLWWTPATSQDPGQGQGTANVIEVGPPYACRNRFLD